MFFAGRIETTDLQEIIDLPDTFGLDTAGKRRLLDQRIALVTNCRVARINSTLTI